MRGNGSRIIVIAFSSMLLLWISNTLPPPRSWQSAAGFLDSPVPTFSAGASFLRLGSGKLPSGSRPGHPSRQTRARSAVTPDFHVYLTHQAPQPLLFFLPQSISANACFEIYHGADIVSTQF